MSSCVSNPFKVMQYINKQLVASFADLSKKTTTTVFDVLRSTPLKVDEATKELLDLVEKKGMIVFPKEDELTYYTTSEDTLTKLDLSEAEEMAAWIATEGVQQGENLVIKHFNGISGTWLGEIPFTLLLEDGQWIFLTDDWPSNVTVGRVKHVELDFMPTLELPIIDKRSIQSVTFESRADFSLIFLQKLTRLRKLRVRGFHISLSEPSLPHLEELEMDKLNIVIKTENLRRIQLFMIIMDEETAAFINKQKRLIVLEINYCDNSHFIRLPSTVRALTWVPSKFPKINLYPDLAEKGKRLKLRKFETNVEMENLDWLVERKIGYWLLNGAFRNKEDGKWKLRVNSWKPNLPYLDVKAKLCEIKTNDMAALQLVDKLTTELVLCNELNIESGEIPTLEAVTDLTIKYKITEDQATRLAKVFPQFTSAELKAKGIKN